MKDERIIKEAWLLKNSIQGTGSELYEALVEGKYITRRTKAVRTSLFRLQNYNGKKAYMIRIKNMSGRQVFAKRVTEFEMNNTMMEEF